jgi:hypothetical protein
VKDQILFKKLSDKNHCVMYKLWYNRYRK